MNLFRKALICLWALFLALSPAVAEQGVFQYQMVNSGIFNYIDFLNGQGKILEIYPDQAEVYVPEHLNGTLIIGLKNYAVHIPIEHLHIPKTVVLIDGNPAPFARNISIDEDNPYFMVENNKLYSKDKTQLLHYCTGEQDASIRLEEGLIHLSKHALYGREHLEEVQLPSSLLILDKYCLAQNPNLKQVSIPEGLVQIQENAFYGSGLQTIRLPSSLRKIGQEAFAQTGLQSLELAEGLSHIEAFAFANSALEELKLPSSLESIGTGAFSGIGSLRKVEMAEGIISLEDYAFQNSGLQEIWLPSSLEHIGEGVFLGCDALERVLVPKDSLAEIYCQDLGLPYMYYYDPVEE